MLVTSAGRRSAATERVLPAAAAAHAHRLLDGPGRPGTVIRTYRNTVLIEVSARTGPLGVELLAVTGPSATATPMGLQVPDLTGLTGPDGLVAGDPVTAGESGLLFGDATHAPVRVRIRRWWDDRVLPLRSPATASRSLPVDAGRGSAVPVDRLDALAAALSDPSAPGSIGRAVAGLLGRGPGLTPSGDDVLAGALVGLRAGAAQSDLTAATTAPVLAGCSATTRLSGALLGHAGAGRAGREVLDLLAVLDRSGPVGPALARVLAIGSTSGADLVAGLGIGLRAAVSCPARAATVLAPTTQESR